MPARSLCREGMGGFNACWWSDCWRCHGIPSGPASWTWKLQFFWGFCFGVCTNACRWALSATRCLWQVCVELPDCLSVRRVMHACASARSSGGVLRALPGACSGTFERRRSWRGAAAVARPTNQHQKAFFRQDSTTPRFSHAFARPPPLLAAQPLCACGGGAASLLTSDERRGGPWLACQASAP